VYLPVALLQLSTTSSTSDSSWTVGVRLAQFAADLPLRDLAVRHVNGPHAHALGAEDVVEEPVSDVDGLRRIRDVDRVQGGTEGLRMRLGVRDLAAVDRRRR
jgi:hypothetical protein